MAAVSNSHNSNGPFVFRRPRFADIPASIDIPVSAGDDDEDDETAVVEVDPDALPDDPTELCTLLENENSPRRFWMHIALAYAKHDKIDTAIEIMSKGLQARASVADRNEKLPMLNCLTWLFLQRSREAPKNSPAVGSDENAYSGETKTKEHYLQLATQTLNESTRLDPSAPINSLARGIYSIFKSAAQNINERNHHLEQAMKIFDDAIRSSRGGNMLAVMGKARVLYGRKRYEQALQCYQDVLLKRPDMDPDPRIGIGMCYWSLGYKDDARLAWERVLEIDPESKVAHSLMAAYYLSVTSSMSEYDPEWVNNYRLVIDHTQKAYKLDKNFSMACTTFAGHFFSRKGYPQCDSLARKALEYSDVAGVTSDGYYILGRKAHAQGLYEEAKQHYISSDKTREGGWLPAKLGLGQVQILLKDISGAKLTFESIVQENHKCIEAKILLGTLYAHEVLSNIPRTGFSGSKEDVTEVHKKAIALLESVRNVWKNEKKVDSANESVLLTLARLYENEQPEKALQCLQMVHQIYMELKETDADSLVPIQLLNNMATLYWHQEKFDSARELYQEALTALPKYKEKDPDTDSDALATTLTYNLGRCEEAAGHNEQAKKHYNKILEHHENYVDANMRLTYMTLIGKQQQEGQEMINKLIQSDSSNLEVRALYGWFLSKSKRKAPINIPEDAEQKHYKHTLQHYDKHDRFSLAGMGNLYLHSAREMKRDSEADREKRRKTYEKAVEFFDKCLQLDPKNAYAAQGIAIALVEDRKDVRGASAIFNKVRDTLTNDVHAIVNLGHCQAALENWSRAIEMYENALNKHNQGRDPNILSCLGKVWYSKGKKESKPHPDQSFESFKNSLEYAKKAAEIVKDNPVFMFNVAFVQSELAAQLLKLSETQRSVAGMEAAAKELDEAVQTFMSVASHKQPPYPPKDIESRAYMGRTTRNKFDRQILLQRAYEDQLSAKLAEARRRREEDLRRRNEEAEEARRKEAELKARVAEARRKQNEEAQEYKAKKEQEEREREEMEEELKDKRRRKREVGSGGPRRGKKRTKAESEIDGDSDAEERMGSAKKRAPRRSRSAMDDEEDEGEGPKKGKKRKLHRASGSGNFKSAETIGPEDEEDDDDEVALPGNNDEAPPEKRPRKRAILSDDEDDEEMGGAGVDDLFGDDEEMKDAQPALVEPVAVEPAKEEDAE